MNPVSKETTRESFLKVISTNSLLGTSKSKAVTKLLLQKRDCALCSKPADYNTLNGSPDKRSEGAGWGNVAISSKGAPLCFSTNGIGKGNPWKRSGKRLKEL